MKKPIFVISQSDVLLCFSTFACIVLCFWAKSGYAADSRLCKKQANLSGSVVIDRLNAACEAVNKNHWIEALSHYQQVLSMVPENRTALRNRVLMLSKLGAANIARWQAQKISALFSDAEWLELKSNDAIQALRWGEIPMADDSRRFKDTDIAIAQLQKLLEKAGDNQWLRRRLEFDLIVALKDRWRMQDALNHYNKLGLVDRQIPAYVLAAVAEACLYLHHPQKARELYQQALKQVPDNFQWKTGLFYALIDDEAIEQAGQYIKKLNEAEPKHLWTRKDKIHRSRARPNPRKTETERLNALAIAFANQYSKAQQRLEYLLEKAPANQDIRDALATVSHWRGWFRQADGLYRAGLAVEPKHLSMRIGHVQNLIALHQYKQAETALFGLNKFKYYQQTQKLFDQWQAVNGYEFQQQTFTRNSSGTAKGSLTITSDSRLFSKPLAYHYRLFAHYRWSYGNFPEGVARVKQEGMGVEYQNKQWLLTTELHQNQFTRNQTGVKLAGRYQFDDFWSLSAAFDTPSAQTPLRAFANGIYARSLNAEINYRAHENRQWSFSGQYLSFTDGNQRYEIQFSGQQNWVLSPRWRLFLGGELFYSHNKAVNTPYFNPLQDFASELKTGAHILTYRDDKTTFYQHISISPGLYWQQKYSSRVTALVKYEHQWQIGNRIDINYGVTGFSLVYDGGREKGVMGYLNFNVRFM